VLFGLFGDGSEPFVVGVLGFDAEAAVLVAVVPLPLVPPRCSSDPSIDFCGFMLLTLPREAGDSFGR